MKKLLLALLFTSCASYPKLSPRDQSNFDRCLNSVMVAQCGVSFGAVNINSPTYVTDLMCIRKVSDGFYQATDKSDWLELNGCSPRMIR
jgi:hypothetical protein